MSAPAFATPPTTLGGYPDLLSYAVRFFLVPERLNGLTLPATLDWSPVRFAASNASAVLESKGVYAFVVRGEHAHLPTHGYVLYVGITGATASGRTLRARYMEYIRHQQQTRPKRRVGIHTMLNLWKDCLFFFQAPIADSSKISDVEIALNDCLIPPFVQDDFSAEVRAAKAAAGLRG